MASSSNLAVTTVSPEAQNAASPGVYVPPTAFASETPESKSSESVKLENQDAVSVSLSNAPEEKKTPEDEITIARAEKLAEQLRQSLNSSTQIKFDVKLYDGAQKSGGFVSAFNFQVVDRETGRIVRQFPPKEIIAVTQKTSGVFVDAQV